MPLSLLNHSALALFAQRTHIPASARSIGFCAIWVCISSSSSSTRCHVTDINHVLTRCHVTEINYVDRGAAARAPPLQFV